MGYYVTNVIIDFISWDLSQPQNTNKTKSSTWFSPPQISTYNGGWFFADALESCIFCIESSIWSIFFRISWRRKCQSLHNANRLLFVIHQFLSWRLHNPERLVQLLSPYCRKWLDERNQKLPPRWLEWPCYNRMTVTGLISKGNAQLWTPNQNVPRHLGLPTKLISWI